MPQLQVRAPEILRLHVVPHTPGMPGVFVSGPVRWRAAKLNS
jgi:hypothetical protein